MSSMAMETSSGEVGYGGRPSLFDSGVNDLLISPDGRCVVVKTDTVEVPQNWSQYEDLNMQTVSRMKLRKGFGRRILRYELVDTRTGKSEVLLDSPAT
jgi:hypothetical protein